MIMDDAVSSYGCYILILLIVTVFFTIIAPTDGGFIGRLVFVELLGMSILMMIYGNGKRKG
jgi:hypothetical protein